MKDKIELFKSNYKNYLPINIIAFSYATGGAQGEPGGVTILDKEGKFFHFNYAYGDLKKDEILEICPVFLEIELINRNLENFERMNMGMGNTLFVNRTIFPEVKEKTKDKRPDQLFSQWKKIIFDIIKK